MNIEQSYSGRSQGAVIMTSIRTVFRCPGTKSPGMGNPIVGGRGKEQDRQTVSKCAFLRARIGEYISEIIS